VLTREEDGGVNKLVGKREPTVSVRAGLFVAVEILDRLGCLAPIEVDVAGGGAG
jgi:hypothetical protein